MPNNSVTIYKTGIATIIVNYWDGVVDCRHCPFIGTNNVLDACYCKLTGTYVDKNSFKKRADDCLVKFDEED